MLFSDVLELVNRYFTTTFPEDPTSLVPRPLKTISEKLVFDYGVSKISFLADTKA